MSTVSEFREDLDAQKSVQAEERRERYRLLAWRVGVGIVFLGTWEFATDRWVDPFWFSSPSRIIRFFVEWLQTDLLFHLSITLREQVIGYVSGTFLGISLGVILARLEFASRVLDPYLTALMGIPRIALAPLLIIWFGIGEVSKVVLAGMLAFFLCFYATLSGLRSVEQAYINISKIMGMNDQQIFLKVLLPAASPWIITAMKVALPFSLIGAIVGEFIAATGGLGYKIQLYTSQFNTTGAMTGVIILMFWVIFLNELLNRLQAYALRWRPPTGQQGAQEVQ